MTNSNRRDGVRFEKELCELLSGFGFWAHDLAQNSQGQPFDVIAARNGCTSPIDCKVCSKNIFKTERVEENQYLAMRLWEQTGNGSGWFALKLNDGSVYMISLAGMETQMFTKTVISEREIRSLGVPLAEWVARC